MATLKEEFLLRYSEARVIQLTNPDLRAPQAIDTVRLDSAVADANGDFETMVQAAYAEDDSQHIRVGVLLVESILMEYGSATGSAAQAIRAKATDEAAKLRVVTGRGRPAVQTTAILSPYGSFPDMLPSPRLGEDRSGGA
ncbi:MAG: hypothetical protein DRH30_00900 [Deltaproteobacteria bacterium]|nr:MAG: hypothetical protein DRH30_00900 [Deltaproteobacteria bacterium]